jgi:glycosyltransferase involved in cell wall biosynthesis
VHHTLVLGMEVLPLIRRLVPTARIVMTLHDYYAICAHDGQLCTAEGLLCAGPTLDNCKRCLPDRTATDFRMRELHIRGALRAVDRFVAPSNTLRDKFIAWGVEAAKIDVIRNGIPVTTAAPWREAPGGRRDRFAFFGHVNRFKGATIALGASARLSQTNVPHGLALHGGTAFQSEATIATFQAALAAAPDARHAGPYRRADQARLIADSDWVLVPSVWWENAPLVIQEAAQHRRPVICSDVGGMAEAVRHEWDGLHFAVGDPTALAQTMRRAIEEPELWQRLASAITPPRTVADAAADHMALYASLLQAKPASRRRAA